MVQVEIRRRVAGAVGPVGIHFVINVVHHVKPPFGVGYSGGITVFNTEAEIVHDAWVVGTAADGNGHAGGAVVLGVARVGHGIHASAVVVRPCARRGRQRDRLRAARAARQGGHGVCTDLRVAPRDRGVRGTEIPQHGGFRSASAPIPDGGGESE